MHDAEAHLIAQKMLGERLRAARQEKALSQVALAALCHLHVSHVSKIERGGANVTLSTLLTIARALDKTPFELLKDISI